MIWLLILATKSTAWAAENLTTLAPESPDFLTLATDTELSREGYFVLSWSPDSNFGSLDLQQSPNSDFSDPDFSNIAVKRVADTDRVTLTGLVDADYYYRLVADDVVVSNTLTVRVEHHALSRALSFFVLGFVLFGVLLVTIYRGHKEQGVPHVG